MASESTTPATPPTAGIGGEAAAGPSSLQAQFEADPRVYFNQQSGKWSFEQEDGTEMEFSQEAGRWVPVLDEELLAAQQAAYSVKGVDESTPAAPVLARTNKKRKGDDLDPSTSKRPQKAPRQTAIFVSNLPHTTSSSLLYTVFSKAGLILEDEDGEPKIKMYYDESTGEFKGEALIVYLKEDSVGLAERLLDETELELGKGGSMRVKKAEWGDGGGNSEKKENGNGNGAEGGEKKKGKDIKKMKMGRRAEKLQKKLEDWSSEEEDSITQRQKYSRLVVLSGMFTLQELDEDPTLLLDLKEDVREECERLGEVTNVVIYDKEEDGIMTIRFKEEASAQACILKNNNRFFAGRSISAFLFDGTKKYRKSNKGDEFDDEGGEEKEKERLENYAKWLEEDKET